MNSSLRNNFHLTSYDNHLKIQFLDTKKILKLYYVWLRDHCRCSKCYNKDTNQVFSDLNNIPLNIEPLTCEIIADNLTITWKDDHPTVFSLSWLQNIHFIQPNGQEIVLWDINNVPNFDEISISAKNFYKDENGLRHLFTNLKKYGFGIVTEVEPTLEATEKIAEHVGMIKSTFFGKMWSVNENVSDHADAAYTTLALAPHTDNAYLSDASGLQIFHMLATADIGGESILVDGFNAARTLNKLNPSFYDSMCNTILEYHYIEDGYHFIDVSSIIKLHPITQKPLQIKYNMYDRAPQTIIPQEKILTFYEALQTFGRILNNPNNEYCLKLPPGSVLFFDNWRLLHGRKAYRGKRMLCGCYISRDDWTSKARTLGIDIN